MKWTILAVFFLLFPGCAVQEAVYEKDGQLYGVTSGLFRDRWWNYYERGLSFAEGEFYEEAISDMRTAINQRKDDQWRSRTYGMHFIDYFPHRELGIVFYKTEQYEQAEAELERSLETAESAKAKYFLNRTRESRLRRTGADQRPPVIVVEHPREGSITNDFFTTLRADVEDDTYVSSLSVNHRPLLVELAAEEIPVEEKLSLKEGINNIVIQAGDLSGKKVEKKVAITVDRMGPVITIADYRRDHGKFFLSGFLSDSTGIRFLLVNGRRVDILEIPDDDPETLREAEFHKELELPEGTEKITLEVEDLASNRTTGTLYPETDDLSGFSPDQTQSDNLPLLALTDQSGGDILPLRYALLERFIDGTPPAIRIRDLLDMQTVFTESLYLEGSVSDASPIESLFINGESVLKRKGKKVFFNYLSRLKEGANRFIVEAIDSSGNRAEKVVTVNRSIPKIRKIGSRMSISVLPFESRGDQGISSSFIYDGLIGAFVNQRRFRMIEREQIEGILSELKLGQTELADPETATKIGKMAIADSILVGTIYERENSIEILTRLVDTETASIMESEDVFDEDKSLNNIKRLVQALAVKYRQDFPLLQGEVIRKEGKSVLVDLGDEKNVKRDIGLILYREGPEVRHPDTNRLLGSEPVQIGEAKVKDVFEKFSKAVIRKGTPKEVRIRDKVITK